MATLTEQWDSIMSSVPSDWSSVTLQLELRDAAQSEEAALVLSPLNPWHERDWRTGTFRFRAAHTFGYGTAAGLCRKRLGTLDSLGVQGSLRRLSEVSDVRPVLTQGTT
jgi:hypothetical protein